MVFSSFSDLIGDKRSVRNEKAVSDQGSNKIEDDCLSCRLIGGGVSSCLGVWLLYQGAVNYRRPEMFFNKTVPPKLKLGIYSLLGVVFLNLGVLRLAGRTLPFVNLDENEEK